MAEPLPLMEYGLWKCLNSFTRGLVNLIGGWPSLAELRVTDGQECPIQSLYLFKNSIPTKSTVLRKTGFLHRASENGIPGLSFSQA
jgi:hypothetical protein